LKTWVSNSPLGISLFHRRKRRIFLSEAGQNLARGLGGAFDAIEESVSQIHTRAASGVLTVSVLPSFAGGWLVLRLPSFAERHPEIEVRIAASNELFDFTRDDVDVAIRYGSGKWRGGLHVERLMTEDIFPICSPKIWSADRRLRDRTIFRTIFFCTMTCGKTGACGFWRRARNRSIRTGGHDSIRRRLCFAQQRQVRAWRLAEAF
jgi:DNA-binding transcriptional LysR family regulator